MYRCKTCCARLLRTRTRAACQHSDLYVGVMHGVLYFRNAHNARNTHSYCGLRCHSAYKIMACVGGLSPAMHGCMGPRCFQLLLITLCVIWLPPSGQPADCFSAASNLGVCGRGLPVEILSTRHLESGILEKHCNQPCTTCSTILENAPRCFMYYKTAIVWTCLWVISVAPCPD